MSISNTTLYSQQFATPYGEMIVAVNDSDTLVELVFPNHIAHWLEKIANNRNTLIRDSKRCDFVVAQLDEYFARKRRTFDLPVKPTGTPFQVEVWSALQTIPYGATLSYSELAEQIGKPAAIRAVGRANGTNPIPIVIPCHRVIGADGSLTGFGGGLALKEALLTIEGIHIQQSRVPVAQMALL